MPRKPATTREEMIEGAFRLVRREGHEALTARALAAELGCSTQPIMYQFPNLSELREIVYQRADAFHTAYLLSGEDLPAIGLRYVQFAAEESNLFRLLFQSGHFNGMSLQSLIQSPDSAPLLEAFGPTEEPRIAAAHFEALFVAVHGYASLIANNAMPYDPTTIKKTLVAIGEGLLGRNDQP